MWSNFGQYSRRETETHTYTQQQKGKAEAKEEPILPLLPKNREKGETR